MRIDKKRNIQGFLFLDKPKGISSNNALQKIKTIFCAKKAGYIGTLDPLATGMLPICFGKSTKFSHYLNLSDKKYNVTVKFGETTSTSDSEGNILKKRPVHFHLPDLNNALKELTGSINQIPSMYSAIKYNGMPLYKYARKGLNVIRNVRKIFIYQFYYISRKKQLIKLYVHCSKGTYVRTLVEDLGEKLGCGAHVVALRRIQIGSLPYSQLINISDLYKILSTKNVNFFNFFNELDRLLISLNQLISFFPKVYLSGEKLNNFILGKSINYTLKLENYLVRVLDQENKKFIGLGKCDIENTLTLYCFVPIID